MRFFLVMTVSLLLAIGCSDAEEKPQHGAVDAGPSDAGSTDVGPDTGEPADDAGEDGGDEPDASDCPVVIDETCSGVETPKYIPTEDGCGEVRCVALDNFSCGDQMCDRAGEFCDVLVPGVPPEPDAGSNTSYSCTAYPAECLGANATCECVVGDDPASDCAITTDGAMTVTLFAP